MSEISGEQVKKVIDLYTINNSVLKTAEAAGISTVKTRKILITEGLWQSDTSVKVGMLLKQGWKTEEIAEKLHMSVKNVQAYMPYERGMYGEKAASPDAIRSDKYRNRMKKAASMQVVQKGVTLKEQMGENKMRNVENRNEIRKPCGSKVLKLHLELDLSNAGEEEIYILKKYGMMRKSLSRDILVPADITLHALHYAILRCFGWQNSHLHNFSLPKEVFQELTQNQFSIWSKLAGVYFRFPSEDFEDIYWDDDYKEGQSFRTWLRKKYTGPYHYKGESEHYLPSQMYVQNLFSKWDKIEVREFNFDVENPIDSYKVKLKDATIDEVRHAFMDMICTELLERLPIAEVLAVKGTKHINYNKVRAGMMEQLEKIDIPDMIRTYKEGRFNRNKDKQHFLECYDLPVQQVTEQLKYSYDYGDGWEVLISCENVYECIQQGEWESISGLEVDVSVDDLEHVSANYCPLCVEKDGIELVDDAGGIYGFCEMLRTIHEFHAEDEEELDKREEMLDWANMMGWTGRRIRPERTL